MNQRAILSLSALLFLFLPAKSDSNRRLTSFSGIYPFLAHYNNEGECGTGAVMPWAGSLWVVTYGPHCPNGSSDKLYEISSSLNQTIRPESIGGTTANRFIHKETRQLFIGPYVISEKGDVRTIPYSKMPGRLTGTARDLTDPANNVITATMEEGFYRINVHSLDVETLWKDGNSIKKTGNNYAPEGGLLPGVHGKGLYSGQGMLIYANNGEGNDSALTHFDIQSGVLAEWDGKTWKVIRRSQFTDITGPGGLEGNERPASDPIWAIGFDNKSLLLGARDIIKGWTFFRLPKASHSYDGAHGWNTEWPRIRNVGTDAHPDFLMTMHGMFWHFPSTFSSRFTAGIRPRSAYLKVIGDFCRWTVEENGEKRPVLVFGCDDAAKNAFLNTRKMKGTLTGPEQSCSNLWFTSPNEPDHLGPNDAEGCVWRHDNVHAGTPSDAFLFAGWTRRCAWLNNESKEDATITIECDRNGTNQWIPLQAVTVAAGQSAFVPFPAKEKAEWVRLVSNRDARLTASFNYSSDEVRTAVPDTIFRGLSRVTDSRSRGGLLHDIAAGHHALALAATEMAGDRANPLGYFEWNDSNALVRSFDEDALNNLATHAAIARKVVTIDAASVLVIDDKGRRYRLPMGDDAFRMLNLTGMTRICREVVTERDLMNCMGTFYELPAENADGFAKIRPITSHPFRINDFTSYKGLFVMTGTMPDAPKDNAHLVFSKDRRACLWAGAIDDLWKMGKPRGKGGPWKDTNVKVSEPSDPYLIGFYDKRTLTLSHASSSDVTFTIEVDPTGNNDWMTWRAVKVAAGKQEQIVFPSNFQARWIRFRTDTDTRATAFLLYE